MVEPLKSVDPRLDLLEKEIWCFGFYFLSEAYTTAMAEVLASHKLSLLPDPNF